MRAYTPEAIEAMAEGGRRGGMAATGAKKARQGTGENVRRYWERVRNGETERRHRRWRRKPRDGYYYEPEVKPKVVETEPLDDFDAALKRMGF